MKKSQLLLTSLVVVIGILLAACSGGTAATPAKATPSTGNSGSGGSGSSGSTSDFVFDPANATSDNARALSGDVYNVLVGALAESYTVSDDGLDYIFNLRPGVTFHDGSTLNADVVVSNFNRWYDPSDANRGSGSFAAWADNFGGFKGELTADNKAKSTFDGIEKVNELIVLVHMNTVDPDLLTKLSDPAFSIVSVGSFNGGDGGSGPYQVGSVSGSTATLEPFSGYWDKSAIPGSGMDAPLE